MRCFPRFVGQRLLIVVLFSIFLGSFLLPKSVLAGADDEQFWTSGQLTKVIPDSPWRMSVEGIYRYSTTRELAVVQAIRTHLGYKNESGTVFTLIHESRQAGSSKDNESRFGAQVSHKFGFEDFDLNLRYRQEFRLFEDSKVWLNRSRLQTRVTLKALRFFDIVTPFVSSEAFYIWNTVEAREAGSTEFRFPVGFTFELIEKLNLDVAYMDRRTYSDSKETRYAVAFTSLSYEF